MSLTHNDLYMVARAISCSQSHHRRRDSLRQTMLMSLQDFFRVRLSLLDMDFDGLSDPRAITIANHFESRYGSSVASAIRTLHPPQNFRDQHVLILCDVRLWLSDSFEDMHLSLQHLRKDMVLHCLCRHPPYLRPPYSSRSVRASSSALVKHLQCRIRQLYSLGPFRFFQVFFSILPFGSQYTDSREPLTERILAVE